MRILLDSHTLLWWLHTPERIIPKARLALCDTSNELFASAASIWELGLKVSKKKLVLPKNFDDSIKESGIETISFSAEQAIVSLELPPFHRDPFDRALIAQCLSESLTLATRDSQILRYRLNVLEV